MKCGRGLAASRAAVKRRDIPPASNPNFKRKPNSYMKNSTKQERTSIFGRISARMFLTILLSISICTSALAQKQNVSLRLKNASLQSAMQQIKEQTGLDYVMNSDQMNSVKGLTIDVQDGNVSDVMKTLLTNTNFDYTIESGTIIIKEVPRATPQRATLTGTVKDGEGNPVIGATIVIEGTTFGTSTGGGGEFSFIATVLPTNRLMVSFLGMVPYSVVIGNTRNFTITLDSEAVSIGEVVVTGFANIKKETFTGSSVKISAEDLELAGATDISRMLEGKVAGVSIQNVSSTFGAAPKVRIRGVTSISGENKPLWVVDGVVLEDVITISNDQLSSGDPATLLGSSVAGLNPADIETFDILKDASATALYGARAMNGVIVITTKRGKTGAPRITYSSNYTIRTKPRYENFDIMNSADQMAVYTRMERNGYLSQNIVNESKYGAYGLMHKAINAYNSSTGYGLENSPEARREFLNKYAKANTDWFDLLFTNKLQQEHSLSLSSGNDKSRTYASISFLNDAGMTIADEVRRYTVNFRNDTDISKKISLGVQFVGSYRDQKTPGSYASQDDTYRGGTSREFDINPFSYAYKTSRAVRPYDDYGNREFVQMNYAPFNILHELENNFMTLDVVDVRAQADFTYKIVPGLKFNFLGSIRYVKSSREHTVTETSNVAEAYRSAENSTIRESNPYLWSDPDVIGGEKIVLLDQGGFLNTYDNQMLNYSFRPFLTYTKLWNNNKIHELTALGGMEVKYVDRTVRTRDQDGYLYYKGGQFESNPNFARMLAERQTEPMTYEKTRDRFAAFYLNASYAFDRRYSVEATFRHEGSNALGHDASARWLSTWNFGAKWNIANEAFMENATKVDAMSVRLSYGLSANMPPETNSQALFYYRQTYAPGYSESSIHFSTLGNKDLTWEKSYQFNVGFDLSMFGGRLNLNLDYFDRKSFDLISDIQDGGMGGQILKKANYADLYASGFDITLGGIIVRTKDWRWTSNFTFGYSKNEIRNAKNMPTVFDLVKQTGGNKNGYPVNSLFSIPFAGLNPSTGIPMFNNPNGSVEYGYFMQSQDTSGLVHEGAIDPPYTGGFNNTVTWKQLSFNVFFSYQWGNVVRLHQAYSTSDLSDLTAMSRSFKDRWMYTADTGNTIIPSLSDQMKLTTFSGVFPYNNYNYSSARVAKGDFIRLKSISIGYDLPARWLSKTKVFQTINVRVTGKDLWLLYSDKALNGQDPEFFNTGGVALPSLPQVVFSLTIGF